MLAGGPQRGRDREAYDYIAAKHPTDVALASLGGYANRANLGLVTDFGPLVNPADVEGTVQILVRDLLAVRPEILEVLNRWTVTFKQLPTWIALFRTTNPAFRASLDYIHKQSSANRSLTAHHAQR